MNPVYQNARWHGKAITVADLPLPEPIKPKPVYMARGRSVSRVTSGRESYCFDAHSAHDAVCAVNILNGG